MPVDAGLSADLAALADLGRTGDAGQGRHDRILPDLDIVSDLAEIVDLHALVDQGGAHRGTVDRRAGPDIHVVFQDHVSQLLDLPVGAVLHRSEAETVVPDHHVGVKDAAVPDHTVVKDPHAGVQDTVAADLHMRTDVDLRTDMGPLSDAGRAGDRALRRETGPEAVPPQFRMAQPAEIIEQGRNGGIGVVDLDQRGRNRLPGLESAVDQQDAGFRIVDVMFVFGIGIEADVSFPRLFDAGRACNDGSGVADDLATQKFRNCPGCYFHQNF